MFEDLTGFQVPQPQGAIVGPGNNLVSVWREAQCAAGGEFFQAGEPLQFLAVGKVPKTHGIVLVCRSSQPSSVR
jgi:hypothetical protein